MTRPEHVRCENCCYWERREHPPALETSPEGDCRRKPHNNVGLVFSLTPTNGDFWCGEFRAEWPGEEGWCACQAPTVNIETGICQRCGRKRR